MSLLCVPFLPHRAFLERLAAHAAQNGPVPSAGAAGVSSSASAAAVPASTLRSVPVYVQPPRSAATATAAEDDEDTTSQGVGHVAVTVDDAPAAVYECIMVRSSWLCQALCSEM